MVRCQSSLAAQTTFFFYIGLGSKTNVNYLLSKIPCNIASNAFVD